MAPRRRSSQRDIMHRRMGLKGLNNSRPFKPWSKTLVTRTLGEGHAGIGTLAGSSFNLPVNNWNDPLGGLTGLQAGTGSLTKNRHPMNHDDAIADGYDHVQVLSWKAEIATTWIGTSSETLDYIVAYTFAEDTSTEVALTAGTAVRLERLEMMTNPRWTMRNYNAVGGEQHSKPNNSVFISVPNVFAYCTLIARGHQTVEANNGTVSHQIVDSSSSTNVPDIGLFCTVSIFTESGLALPVDSILVTVAITQRVKIMRDKLGGEDMEDGETDVHP